MGTRPKLLETMQSVAVVALALLESVSAFQAPALASKAVQKASSPTMFSEGDIGVLPPLGVYDPLGLIETRDMRRYEIMEIKHGRAAMLGFLHVIALKAGIVLPGALTLSGTKFADIPTSCFGWLQIMLFCLFQETGFGLGLAYGQTGGYASNPDFNNDDGEPGDIASIPWVRYDDPETKTFKLN